MLFPDDVFITSDGTLWVADRENNRVLRFDNAAAKSNGANADGVLGQSNFTSNLQLTTQVGMLGPRSVFVDNNGTLWVAEEFNNRILRFDNVASKSNGANADGVLGQPNFTSSSGTTSQAGLYYPMSVAVDNTGRLYVTQETNNRVLIFDDAANKANGANADNVLGQSNFTSSNIGITASTVNGGWRSSVEIDNINGYLWVSDSDNNCVIRFNGNVVAVPSCSTISSPADGATSVAVDANLSWSANANATGYKLKIGTSSGAGDFLAEINLNNVTTYDPLTDFAPNTTYYVTLTTYNATGDATGCTETTFTTEVLNNALEFDGTDDAVHTGMTDYNDTEVTLETWVKLDNTTNVPEILTKWDITTTRDFRLLYNSVLNAFQISWFGSTSIQNLETTTSISANTWYHIAVTYDGTDVKIYLNGVEEGSGALTGPLRNSSSEIYLGARMSSSSSILDGQLDEVRIWKCRPS